MDLQILACECLCNLALGTEVACKKVALAAGISLATFLEDAPRLQVSLFFHKYNKTIFVASLDYRSLDNHKSDSRWRHRTGKSVYFAENCSNASHHNRQQIDSR